MMSSAPTFDYTGTGTLPNSVLYVCTVIPIQLTQFKN